MTTSGVSGSTSIEGSDAGEKLVGGGGSDTIDGGRGSDFINAGGGNDTIIYDEADYKILGGGGIDTLLFLSEKQNLNFGTQAINGIEALQLGGMGGHRVTFSAADVVRVSDTDRFVITGDKTSTVNFSDSGWTWGGLINNNEQSLFTKDGATVVVDRTVNVAGFSYNATVTFREGSDQEVKEDEGTPFLDADGTLTVTDQNAGQAFLLPSMLGTLTSLDEQGNPNLGQLYIGVSTLTGSYLYGYSVDNDKVHYLGAGQTRTEDFWVETVDGTRVKLPFTIVGVNDAPELTDVQATLATGVEDTDYTISVADLLQGFTDADIDDTLAVENLTANNGMLVKNSNDPNYTFTPSANYNGTITLNYRVVDEKGAFISATQSFSLTAVNDAPTLTGTQAALANGFEDTSYHITVTDLLKGFSDVDGDALAVENLTANDGTLVKKNDGTYTFTPTADYNGTVTLNYRVIDGKGGSADGTRSFSLAAVNDAPSLTGTQATLAAGVEDTDYRISVDDLLKGFSDVDGDALSMSGLTTTNGTLVNNNNGSYTFKPNANHNGSVALSYRVVDEKGAFISATQSFSLTAVNDAPSLTGTQATLAAGVEDTDYRISVDDLLKGFSDVDGDALAVANLTGNDRPLVNNDDGTYTFTPPADYNGTVTLNYRIIDGKGGSTDGTRSFILAAVNDAPTFTITGSFQLEEDTNVRDGQWLTTVITLRVKDPDIGESVIDKIESSLNNIGGLTQRANSGDEFLYVYQVNNNDSKIQGLNSGQTWSDSFTLFSRDGSSTIFRFEISGKNEPINGTAGNDTISGTSGADLIYGLDGNDRIAAEDGNDTVYGGSGDDTILGGSGNDILYGNDGNDTLVGGTGVDSLYAGAGNDLINARYSEGNFFGEEGDDFFEFNGESWGSLNGGSGRDTFIFHPDSDYGNATYAIISDFDVSKAPENGGDVLRLPFSLTGLKAEAADATYGANAFALYLGDQFVMTLIGVGFSPDKISDYIGAKNIVSY